MKKYILISLCVIMLFSMCTCGKAIFTKPNEDLPINYIHGSTVIDMNNPKEVVGFGDYVFVAKINEEIETVQRNVKVHNFKRTGMPYTIYSITVIDNLKGKIKKNTPILFEKFGGINIDNKSISLHEGDELLEEGKYYIIIAGGQPDGKLSQVGSTGSIKLDIESKNEIISSQKYKDYKKYCEEEIDFERQRSKSKYEEE